MNLMKLFNFKYLMQNIKKSINKVVFIILIVPILTTLILINNNENYFSSNIMLSNIVNLIAMYIVPIVISKILYGYIFKRKSVDFIGSMPISRKSIFITNFIGGIIIILFIQLLTYLSIGIMSMFLENLAINFNMLVEFFIAGVISYIFVFSATNIAMAISGNVYTQIVVTALILFLIPFTIDALRNFDYSEECKFISDNLGETNCEITKPHEFTLPYNLISVVLVRNETFISNNVIIKMSILSVIYFVLGLILFQKRKMENTEEAFSNIYIHLIIKGLTLVPIAYLLFLSKPEIKMLTLVIAIIFAYYFIYDLITKRKVKLIVNAVSVLISVSLFYGILYINDEYLENKVIEYNVDDIQEIGLRQINDRINLERINNKEIISELFSYTQREGVSGSMYTPIKITKKNKKKLETTIYVERTDLEKIYNKIYEDKEYINREKENAKIVDSNGTFIYYDNLLIKGEEKEEFIKNINKTYEKYYNGEANYVVDNISNHWIREPKVIKYYNYDNYNVEEKKIRIDLSDELLGYCIEYTNNRTKEMVKDKDIRDSDVYFEIYNDQYDKYNEVYREIKNYKYNGINRKIKDYKALIKYIKEDKIDVSDIEINDPILKLDITLYEEKGNSIRVEYYVRDIEKFISEFQIGDTNGIFSNLLPAIRPDSNKYKK